MSQQESGFSMYFRPLSGEKLLWCSYLSSTSWCAGAGENHVDGECKLPRLELCSRFWDMCTVGPFKRSGVNVTH